LAKTPFERRRGLAAPDAPTGAPVLSLGQRRLLRFFPGLLPRRLADKLAIDPQANGLIPVGTTHFLIPPGWRDRDPSAAPRDFDAMAEIEAEDVGLHALTQTFCTSYFAESRALIALSRKAHFAG